MYAGGANTEASASEYVFELSTGGHVQITDETMGFGFATIAQYDDVACTAAQTLGGEMNSATAFTLPVATVLTLILANLF